MTWAQRIDSHGHVRLKTRFRGGAGLRWDTAERNVLGGLQTIGLRDVFRALHGYEQNACSWMVRRKGVARSRRFDHVFASERLKSVNCLYLNEWREAGLSDHAAVEAVFELSAHSSPA